VSADASDWIGAVLAGARPQAMAALLRYFRNLDEAEEAFQESCLRALSNWPKNGPPRDPAAWLIMVGRNSGVDAVRRRSREQPLPSEEILSDLSDAEAIEAERIDESHYRDDILRLLFVCCHPALSPAHQIALALRIVSGLPVSQIARAFLTTDAAMEQRITRAKRQIAQSDVPFETPGAVERSERIGAVAAVVYLMFNEGYTRGVPEEGARARLCDEAIRLGRLLLRIFPTEPEIMALLALMQLQHARAAARFDADGGVILLEDQDRGRWDQRAIIEGLALVEKAVRHRSPGPYQIQAAIAALHARAPSSAETDWNQIAALYAALERMQPSPVVTLNRAVAVWKAEGAGPALALVDTIGDRLDSYFYFHGARGALLKELGRVSEARTAFDRAIALANTPAEAAHIRMELDRLVCPSAVHAEEGLAPRE
jgi:RNA polymerase sigma-70 factor (ECF subfamily)